MILVLETFVFDVNDLMKFKANKRRRGSLDSDFDGVVLLRNDLSTKDAIIYLVLKRFCSRSTVCSRHGGWALDYI